MRLEPAQSKKLRNPILILAIANGAGHIRVAQGIAASIRSLDPAIPTFVADVSDYMTRLARLTHVTTFLWLVKHAPAVWDQIDRYQKKQSHTSPDWYYRRGCRRLFELAREVQPRAIVATEVGCCEIAALIKRDLALNCPLVAVNDDYDFDRAWIQPEVDLYCFVTEHVSERLISRGAHPDRVRAWGAPLSEGYDVSRSRQQERELVCRRLRLDADRPLVLVAGGGEGMGRIEESVERLLSLKENAPQLIVLSGRNARVKSRCERLAHNGASERLRVLGWTGPEQMPSLMRAADLMVSKLGSMFNEALACELPIVALEPPPGSERVQYLLLDQWQVGCALKGLDELTQTISQLLAQPEQLERMRANARARHKPNVSARIARWVLDAVHEESAADEQFAPAFGQRSLERRIVQAG